MKVFLSHSSTDGELAGRLSRDLRSTHVEVWLDQWAIGVGEEFVQVIERGLAEAEFVIVLLTNASVASDWVQREWRSKVEAESTGKRIAIVPVRGEACEIPDFLAQRSYADISGGAYPLGFRYLLTMLRHYAADPTVEIPAATMRIADTPAEMLPVVAPIGLDVGAGLIPLFDGSEGPSRIMEELLPRMCDALGAEYGFPFPGTRVRGNDTDMPARGVRILIDEVPQSWLEVSPDEADAGEYICSALEHAIRPMVREFLDIDVTFRLVEALASADPELVAATAPKAVSWFELTNILQFLVDEEISIGDIGRILEALRDRDPKIRDTVALAEQVRHALSGQITLKFSRGRDALRVLALDSAIDTMIAGALRRSSLGNYLALEPEQSEEILAAVRAEISALGPAAVGLPILSTDPEVRPYVRRIVMQEFPWLHALSRQDVAPGTRIETVAHISLNAGATA